MLEQKLEMLDRGRRNWFKLKLRLILFLSFESQLIEVENENYIRRRLDYDS